MKVSTKPVSPWLHRFTVFTAAVTFLVLCAGALVTSTDSGLAVPDWPLSYGMLFPPMVGGILYEHGHRLIAGTAALLTCLQAIFLWRSGAPNRIQKLALSGSVLVLTQALLGGITVLLLLPKSVSVSHACLAQLFFCVNVTLSLMTSTSWNRPAVPLERGEGNFPLSLHCTITAVGFFFQLLMGAIMRHTGAGLAIPDFPLAFGGLIPPFETFGVLIHFAHRMGAYTMLLLSLSLAVRFYRYHRDRPGFVAWSFALVGLVLVQGTLGAFVIWMVRPVVITSLHLAVGALCFACAVTLAVRVSQLSEAKFRFPVFLKMNEVAG